MYKRNKNKQKRKNAIPTPGREEGNHDRNIHSQGREQEVLKIHGNKSETNNEPIYNHGQEVTNNNERLTLQNIDDGALQQLKNEMLQTLRQEMMQNNGQASTKK